MGSTWAGAGLRPQCFVMRRGRSPLVERMRGVRVPYEALSGCRPAGGARALGARLDGFDSRHPEIPWSSWGRSTAGVRTPRTGETPVRFRPLPSRASSSVGRAPRWHRGGQRFDPAEVQFAGVAPRRSASLPWKRFPPPALMIMVVEAEESRRWDVAPVQAGSSPVDHPVPVAQLDSAAAS